SSQHVQALYLISKLARGLARPGILRVGSVGCVTVSLPRRDALLGTSPPVFQVTSLSPVQILSGAVCILRNGTHVKSRRTALMLYSSHCCCCGVFNAA